MLYVCYILITLLKDVWSFLNFIKGVLLKGFLRCLRSSPGETNKGHGHPPGLEASLRKLRLTRYDGQVGSKGLPFWVCGGSGPHGHPGGAWIKPGADASPADPGPRPSPSQAPGPLLRGFSDLLPFNPLLPAV